MRSRIESLADHLLARLVPRVRADAAGCNQVFCYYQQFGEMWCPMCKCCEPCFGCPCSSCHYICGLCLY